MSGIIHSPHLGRRFIVLMDSAATVRKYGHTLMSRFQDSEAPLIKNLFATHLVKENLLDRRR